MFVASSGKCAKCGCLLSKGFHADHKVPYSSGGATNLDNGQPLCRRCNLKKGSKMPKACNPTPMKQTYKAVTIACASIAAPGIITPWRWQSRFIDSYLAADLRDYLMVVTTAGGKTTAALLLAQRLLKMGVVKRVVVLVPTTPLRKQWADEAHKLGIKLDPMFKNAHCKEGKGYHGIVVTYASVGARGDDGKSGAKLHRHLCSQDDTLVILDEAHHVGDKRHWGASVKYAFGGATKRLLLSGTPFRPPNTGSIPFVTYNEKRESVANFSYSLGEAMEDGHCRLVIFSHYDGEGKWKRDGKIVRGQMSKVNKCHLSSCLRTLLDLDKGPWLEETIREAHDKLLSIRVFHPTAGGLIVCEDQEAAKAMAKLLTEITGETPELFISDDMTSAKRLKEWRKKSTCMWTVAVRMVSEGVDCPRLRVGVYATNIKSETHFKQFVGRFLRVIKGLDCDQTSYVFIPAHPELVEHARKIREEMVHVLEEEKKAGRGGIGGRTSTFSAISSGSSQFSGNINQQDTYTPDELRATKQYFEGINPEIVKKLSEQHLVELWRHTRTTHQGNIDSESTDKITSGNGQKTPVKKPEYELQEETQAVHKRLARSLGSKIQDYRPETDSVNAYQRVYTKLMHIRNSYKGQRLETHELQKEIEILSGWHDDFDDAVKRGEQEVCIWIDQWGWMS